MFLSLVLIVVPLHAKKLLYLLISIFELSLSSSQENLLTSLSSSLLQEFGWILLGSAVTLLLLSVFGYIGAVKDSKICLIMVSFIEKQVFWSV